MMFYTPLEFYNNIHFILGKSIYSKLVQNSEEFSFVFS